MKLLAHSNKRTLSLKMYPTFSDSTEQEKNYLKPVVKKIPRLQPEVDSKLQHMQQLDLSHGELFLNFCLHLKVLIAVPQPAEGLDQNRGDHQEQHQDTEAHIVLFLVETHHSPYIQPNVGQQEDQTEASQQEVQPGELENGHCVVRACSSHISGGSCVQHSCICQEGTPDRLKDKRKFAESQSSVLNKCRKLLLLTAPPSGWQELLKTNCRNRNIIGVQLQLEAGSWKR